MRIVYINNYLRNVLNKIIMEKINKLFEKKEYDKIFQYIEKYLSEQNIYELCSTASKYGEYSILDYIISSKYNILSYNKIFCFFCKTGNISIIQKFLNKYPKTKISKKDCLYSIHSGNAKCFFYIMNITNIKIDTEFFSDACRYGNRDMLEFIDKKLENFNIDDSIIQSACFTKNPDIIEYLVEKGLTNDNITRIARVACLCNHVNIFKHLLDVGCKDRIDIHSSTNVYSTIPLICCQYGYINLFDIILKTYSDIDILSCFQQAHENRQREIREYIINYVIMTGDFILFKKCCKVVDNIYFYNLCKTIVPTDTIFHTYVCDKIKQLTSFSQFEY